jgi:hypothetical protein
VKNPASFGKKPKGVLPLRSCKALRALMIYTKLKQLYEDVKNHPDLTYKSIPFFVKVVKDIRVELLKVTAEEGEQVSRDVMDASRLIAISEREDLNNIQNYPKEIPKYLGRVRETILMRLAFVTKK